MFIVLLRTRVLNFIVFGFRLWGNVCISVSFCSPCCFPQISCLQGVSVRCVGGDRHDRRPAPISARLQSAVQQPIKDRRGALFESSLCSLSG